MDITEKLLLDKTQARNKRKREKRKLSNVMKTTNKSNGGKKPNPKKDADARRQTREQIPATRIPFLTAMKEKTAVKKERKQKLLQVKDKDENRKNQQG